MLRPIDAHADIDLPLDKKFAPRRGDQHSVGLEGMHDAYMLRPQLLYCLERLAIKVDRHHQRLAGMPDHVDVPASPARGEQLEEQVPDRALLDHRPIITVWQIAISAIDVAERRWLDH